MAMQSTVRPAGRHGESPLTWYCQHLVPGTPAGHDGGVTIEATRTRSRTPAAPADRAGGLPAGAPVADHPGRVGLPPGLRRRTPGLRREEVAQLAGVGVTWYTWLEQGRPINVSVQVLDAVARTLRLDARRARAPLPAGRHARGAGRDRHGVGLPGGARDPRHARAAGGLAAERPLRRPRCQLRARTALLALARDAVRAAQRAVVLVRRAGRPGAVRQLRRGDAAGGRDPAGVVRPAPRRAGVDGLHPAAQRAQRRVRADVGPPRRRPAGAPAPRCSGTRSAGCCSLQSTSLAVADMPECRIVVYTPVDDATRDGPAAHPEPGDRASRSAMSRFGATAR